MHRVITKSLSCLMTFLFLSSFLNIFLKILLLENTQATSGLYPKSLPVKYSYFSKSLKDSADILATSLTKSY